MAFDDFDYHSEVDYSDIDDQTPEFEFRQLMKNRRTKQKIRKPPCSVPTRTLKSFPTVIKARCINYSQTPKAEKKSFRYDRYSTKPILFECDREFQVIEQEPLLTPPSKKEKKSSKRQAKRRTEDAFKINHPSQSTKQTSLPKKLKIEQSTDFPSFRRQFYQLNHHLIKSSFESLPFIQINNIRLASIKKSVQDHFMNTLKTYSYLPQLVYHGTEMNSIKSILQYGLLIPYQQHPTIPQAPVIGIRAGQAYGSGIYCDRTAHSALKHTDQTNTLLVCAALPIRHGRNAAMEHCFSDILVLKQESRIIPLFLLDVKYLNGANTNYPWFDYEKKVPVKEKKQVTRTSVISRKYLRKVLGCINDEARKHDLYQIRQYEVVN